MSALKHAIISSSSSQYPIDRLYKLLQNLYLQTIFSIKMKFTTVVLAVFGIIASASAAPTAESDIVIKLSPELHKRLPEAELTELIKSTILKSRDLELEARGCSWYCGFGLCGTTTQCCIQKCT
ncbi:hypothetical protein TWF106_007926 [Orbilia oligospora]|nr:hypothetical protein TWF106_007926 [Orbilia oligospora]KAF3255259.1 hypothetical protein TWF192_002618 [Orbilia oligospora]